jgi:hypothetical protein
VRRVALIRAQDRAAGARRARDALDALGESLAQRGIGIHTVEIGPGLRADLEAVEQVFDHARWRIEGEPLASGSRPVVPLGVDAAPVLARLDVDALALLFRFDPRWAPGQAPFAPVPYAPWGARPQAGRGAYRPIGALALIGRGNAFVWFDWGASDGLLDTGSAVNPAEAVEQALRLFTAVPLEPEDG